MKKLSLFALLENLKAHLKAASHGRVITATLLFSLALLSVISFPQLLEVFRYFCPLLFSTGLCLAAAVLWFNPSINQERVMEIPPATLVFIYEDCGQIGYDSATKHDDESEECCFPAETESELLETPFPVKKPEEKEEDYENQAWFYEDVFVSAESLAEGVWNYYLGQYSRWHYTGLCLAAAVLWFNSSINQERVMEIPPAALVFIYEDCGQIGYDSATKHDDESEECCFPAETESELLETPFPVKKPEEKEEDYENQVWFYEDVFVSAESLAEGVWNYYLGRYSRWH